VIISRKSTIYHVKQDWVDAPFPRYQQVAYKVVSQKQGCCGWQTSKCVFDYGGWTARDQCIREQEITIVIPAKLQGVT
jgi:hypothetical protein